MRQCEICGSIQGQIYGKSRFGKDLCRKHYSQMLRNGKILERSLKDYNEIIINGDTIEIVLYDIDNKECGRSLADSRFYSIIKQYKWNLSRGYVISKTKGPAIKLHRLVTDAPNGMVVDHINHNTVDNRLINLRVCTQSENMCNAVCRSNNTSGYKGVSWDKSKSSWSASIQFNNKSKFLGRFSDINDAINARMEAEIKYFGQYAYNGVTTPNSGTIENKEAI